MSGKRLILWLQLLALACVSPTADPPGPPTDGRMKKYIVRLEGRNYLLADKGGPRRFGFATTRHVEAMSPNEAEQAAIREIQEDVQLNASLLNDASNPPQVTATQHIEVDSFESVRTPEFGYIFYEDHDTR
jgi:hypothetical protein